jgi:RNA polymerase sigma-70 factor (ECF subfamily)
MTDAPAPEVQDRLLSRCSAGEVGAFAEVYRLFGRGLFGTALRMLGNREEAEDAVHEAFLSFHRRAGSLPDVSLLPWLRRVVANECIDRIRRRARWQTSEIEESNLAAAPEAPAGLRIDLERAVLRLPAGARTVFVLHDVEGFRHEEVAQMLGITEGGSKSQLFRARELLRARLQERPEDAP